MGRWQYTHIGHRSSDKLELDDSCCLLWNFVFSLPSFAWHPKRRGKMSLLSVSACCVYVILLLEWMPISFADILIGTQIYPLRKRLTQKERFFMPDYIIFQNVFNPVNFHLNSLTIWVIVCCLLKSLESGNCIHNLLIKSLFSKSQRPSKGLEV